MKKNLLVILTATLGLAATPGAWADMIYDAPAGPYFQGINSERIQAGSFQSGSAASQLADVVLHMQGGNGGGNFTVQLWDATGTSHLPGTLLETLSGSANPSAAGDYTYTGSYNLAANTAYWIEAGVSSGSGSYNWFKSPSGPTVGSAPYGRATYYYGWAGPYSESLAMQVHDGASAVPEPSQWAMMGMTLLGAGGYALRQWRNRKV